MDGMHNLLVYFSVFMVVFLPYVFVSFFLNKPKVSIDDLDGRNIPSLFRRLWGVLSCFSEAAGALVGARMTKRTKKLARALVAANIRMGTDYIYAAEMLLCVLGGVGGVLLFPVSRNRISRNYSLIRSGFRDRMVLTGNTPSTKWWF